MILKDVETENPSLHWEFVNCKNKICIDLGCGRWEHIEYRDPNWPTTPEWLIINGAKEVYAFDMDEREIEWYKENISNKYRIFPFFKEIKDVQDIRNIISEYKPDMIKCDIEGAEIFLLELTDDEFCSITSYAIETHSEELHEAFINKFTNLGYTVIAQIDLIHAKPMKVLFAEK